MERDSPSRSHTRRDNRIQIFQPRLKVIALLRG